MEDKHLTRAIPKTVFKKRKRQFSPSHPRAASLSSAIILPQGVVTHTDINDGHEQHKSTREVHNASPSVLRTPYVLVHSLNICAHASDVPFLDDHWEFQFRWVYVRRGDKKQGVKAKG